MIRPSAKGRLQPVPVAIARHAMAGRGTPHGIRSRSRSPVGAGSPANRRRRTPATATSPANALQPGRVPERAPGLLLALALALGLGLACAPVAAAEIYRTTDEDGNVVYTDDPPDEDAEPVELDPLTTVPGTAAEDDKDGDRNEAAGGDAGGSRERQPDSRLRGIRIAYPEGGEGIRHNGGNVPFRVALEPEGAGLPAGHSIEIVLDGEVRARGTGKEIVVAPVSRGEHSVRARVLDAQGDTRFASETIEFFLLRKAVGNAGG